MKRPDDLILVTIPGNCDVDRRGYEVDEHRAPARLLLAFDRQTAETLSELYR